MLQCRFSCGVSQTCRFMLSLRSNPSRLAADLEDVDLGAVLGHVGAAEPERTRTGRVHWFDHYLVVPEMARARLSTAAEV